MNNFAATFSEIDRYDDGISVNYSTMLRLWSAFDRSINAFNRKCGVLPRARKTEPRRQSSEPGNKGK